MSRRCDARERTMCLYNDANQRSPTTGGYSLTYFDEFIDQLLTEERVCDVILPRLTKRDVLEETEGLAPRKSLLVRLPPRCLSTSVP